MSLAHSRLGGFGIDAAAVRWWVGVSSVEAVAVLAYLSVMPISVQEPRYAIYPFVWINVGLWAVLRTSTVEVTRRRRLLAGALAAGYLLVLLYASGLVRFGLGGSLGVGSEFRVSWPLLGWGPVVVFRNQWIQTVVVPFKAAGYVSLAYLAYARLLELTKALASSALGLVACVGCTFSVLLPLVGGGVTGLAATARTFSWDLSTVVFLLTVALLYQYKPITSRISGWVERQRVATW